MVWKLFSRFFHGMEEMFPWCGKLLFRAHGATKPPREKRASAFQLAAFSQMEKELSEGLRQFITGMAVGFDG